MKQNKHALREQVESRGLFDGGTVSCVMCPADGQQKNDENGQTGDKPRWGQRQSRKVQL